MENDIVNDVPGMRLSLEELERIIEKGDDIIKWIQAVKEYGYQRAMNGHKFNSLKLVNGRSFRSWNKDLNVEQGLKDLGIQDPYNHKLKGVTEIEKEVGKGQIDHLTVKPPGKLQLVPNTDKRQEVELSTNTVDFDDVSLLND